MLIIILEWLKSVGFKVPAVFEYTSTRMMLSALTTLVLTIGLGPRFIKKLYELKIGQTIRLEECPLLGMLHEKKKDTPTMGGLLMIATMLVSLLLFMDLRSLFTLILFLTTVVIGFLGARDDYLKLKYKNTKGLSSKKKLIFQVGFAALIGFILYSPTVSTWLSSHSWITLPVAKAPGGLLSLSDYLSRLYVPFFKEPFLVGGGLMFFFFVFVFTGSSNAVNLTDGLDGLAAGALIMTASALALVAFLSNNADIAAYLNILYIEQSGEVAVYLSALCGAALGFLWYNSHPAQVFMGDTGSLSLGAIIGVSACLLDRQLLLAIVGGLFVIEALSVILQVGSYRLRNKKRIFACAPLHHHFEYKGWPETKVVIRFWIVALILSIIGIASLKFQ